ncbi:MAG: hypothetical protein KF812_05575 [Fimbriimonadaceae bacterium]|nr:hypothetical protein [Fimbriimonadaceae bacterium]
MKLNPVAHLRRKILLGLSLFFILACGGSGGPSQDLLFTVKLTWDQSADLDLHVWMTPTSQCSQDGCNFEDMEMSPDFTTGTGPELYKAYKGLGSGRLRVGVNLHEIKPPASAGPRSATISITDITGAVVATFGPYVLTDPIEDGGYPVTGDTTSWWRPCDIIVAADGTYSVVAPDMTPLSY